jgi:pimeloyl-ACP methyl ester carboxylesterase
VAHWARPGDDEAFWPLVRRVMSPRGQRGISFGEDELRRLELPVRLVWGRRDNFAHVSVGARAAELLPHGDLRVVDGGHLPWLTSPRAVAAHAHEFLAERQLAMLT